jgi:hypothetical protein
MIFRGVFLAAVFLLCTLSLRAEIFTANLTGAQEVPPTGSTATGYSRIFVNESTLAVSWVVVFNGLSSAQNGAHIHAPAPIGMNAAIIIPFATIGGTSGTITGSGTITATQLSQMRQHLAYVNVHSTNFPGGEIRGQLGPARPVDYDGDGRMDLSVLRFPSGTPAPITYWNLNSTTGLQVVSPFGDANTDFPVPGDYDGDGSGDIALYRAGATAGAQSIFYILRSSDSTTQAIAFGLNGDQAICRDYDGDGITDLAIYRRGALSTDTANWWIRRSSSPNNFLVVPFGLTGNGSTTFDTPVPGDYDGDGKFDIAVYRFGLSPANTFIILRSSDSAVVFQQWGNFNSDYIVPGDYDGDGKFDFAAARTGATASSPMVWWILQTSNLSVRVQSFGISSDLPTQGDYDGDARADISIYRPGATASSQAFFWVFQSFTNTSSAAPWGLGSDFPVATFDAR